MIAALVIAAGLTATTPGLRPPPEYDYAPSRPYTVVEVDDTMLRAACQFRDREATLYGCAVRETWTMFILEYLPIEIHLEVVRHEQAHFNNWEHD